MKVINTHTHTHTHTHTEETTTTLTTIYTYIIFACGLWIISKKWTLFYKKKHNFIEKCYNQIKSLIIVEYATNFIWCLRYKSLIIICLINYNLQKWINLINNYIEGFPSIWSVHKLWYNFYDSIIYPLHFKWFMTEYYFISIRSLIKTSMRHSGV